MTFSPELQTRIDAVKPGGGDLSAMTEIDRLKAKLAARDGKPGFKDNCADIRARIAALET